MILVVDDHKDTCSAVRGLLASEGFATTGVYNGADALRAINQSKPQLMVLDMMMPEMSGLDVLRSLRSNPATADLPVMLYTASMNDQDLEEAQQLGAKVVVKGMTDWGQFASIVRSQLAQ